MIYQILKNFFACCVVLMAIMCFTSIAEAHDPGLSAANVKLERHGLIAHLAFAQNDIENLVTLDTNQDGQLTRDEFNAVHEQLERLAEAGFEIHIDAQRLAPQNIKINFDDSNTVNFVLRYAGQPTAPLEVQSPIIKRLPRGHRQYLAIAGEDGAVVAEKMLDADGHTLALGLAQLSSAIRPQSFGNFFQLGVEHILTGYDHLVFLLALLVAGANFRQAAKIITSFTVAHSITLALATLDVVRLSASLVEPLIAASIIYVGIENLFCKEMDRRWLLTFAFGLIHGFGFASVLSELGIAANTTAVVPLLAFNLGVEFGQLSLACAILPLVWRFKSRPVFVERFVPACSLLIALAGGAWLIGRTLLT